MGTWISFHQTFSSALTVLWFWPCLLASLVGKAGSLKIDSEALCCSFPSLLTSYLLSFSAQNNIITAGPVLIGCIGYVSPGIITDKPVFTYIVYLSEMPFKGLWYSVNNAAFFVFMIWQILSLNFNRKFYVNVRNFLTLMYMLFHLVYWCSTTNILAFIYKLDMLGCSESFNTCGC